MEANVTKFKKGDVVRATKGDGKVMVGDIGVCAANSSRAPYVDWSRGFRWAYITDDMELVTFITGQRVVLNQDNDLWGKKGDAGTVISVGEEVRVRFDKTVHGQREWLVDVRRLAAEPAAAQEKWVPKVGDRVRYDDGTVSGVGTIDSVAPLDQGPYDFMVRVDAKDIERAYYHDGTCRLFKTASLAPAPFTIEAGRYYKTRDGRKVGPVRAITSNFSEMVWEADQELRGGKFSNWDKDGVCFPRSAQKYWTDCDLVALWPDEPTTNVGAQVDTLSDEYGQGVTSASVTASKPKFKVGDRVVVVKNDGIRVSFIGFLGTITKGPYGGFTDYTVRLDGDGYRMFSPHEIALTTPTAATPTAIVCLIEDGKPKPATRPYVHGTKESATTEAKRLAGIHKGQEFGVYVLADTAKEERVYEREWQRLAMAGRKIDAIRMVRAATGLHLATAKTAVDDWVLRAAA